MLPCRFQVLDSLVISLSKYTALLNPAHPKAAIVFGNNERARAATATLFDLVNRCRPHAWLGASVTGARLRTGLDASTNICKIYYGNYDIEEAVSAGSA